MIRSPETPDDDTPEQMAKVIDMAKYRNRHIKQAMGKVAGSANLEGSKFRHPASQNHRSSPGDDEPSKPSPLEP